MNRWQRPGDELHTNVPGLLTQKEFENTLSRQFWFGKSYEFADNIWTMYDYSNLRVVSGDYVKLQGLSLRYVVPQRFCSKLALKSAYINLSGSNLYTFCSKKLKGQDPTQSGSSDLINLSVRPMYSFQINLTF